MSKTRDLANLADLNFDSGTMVVDKANDRVGVGTSLPSTYGGKLNIVDGSVGGETTLVVANNNANQFIRMGVNADVAQIAYDNADSLAFGITTDSTTSGLTTEHMRITSAGDVLVGKTSVDSNAEGFEAESDGKIAATRDGGRTAIFNRLTSDGEIVAFRKDGTTVGSIGAVGGDIYVGTGNVSLRYNDGGNDIRPATSNGSNRDNLIDLGDNGARFKDLYLSGGVYLGGTGSANHLDDYEEGSFETKVYDGSTLSTANDTGYYTKVGRIVHITCRATNFITTGLNGTPSARFPLPFAASSLDFSYGMCFIRSAADSNFDGTHRIAVETNSNYFKIEIDTSGGTQMTVNDVNNGNTDIFFTLTYLST